MLLVQLIQFAVGLADVLFTVLEGVGSIAMRFLRNIQFFLEGFYALMDIAERFLGFFDLGGRQTHGRP